MDYNEYLASRLAKLADDWEKMNGKTDLFCRGYVAALRDLSGPRNGLGDLAIYHSEWKKL